MKTDTDMQTFELVSPDNLQSIWNWVRHGLLRVLDKSPDTWLPEDVYARIKMKACGLYVVRSGMRFDGFWVEEYMRDNFSGQPYLHIWIVYASPRGNGNDAEFEGSIDSWIDEAEKHCRAMGGRRMTCDARLGWGKMLKNRFKAKRVRFEREVSYG